MIDLINNNFYECKQRPKSVVNKVKVNADPRSTKIGPNGSEFELFVVPNLKSCAGLD